MESASRCYVNPRTLSVQRRVSNYSSTHKSLQNPLCRAARTADGRDVVIRVLATGESGRDHVDILDLISRNYYITVEHNHAIPLLEFVDFEDITFGIFPKISARRIQVLDQELCWRRSQHDTTVFGGALASILLYAAVHHHCLQALTFLHYIGIAHRVSCRFPACEPLAHMSL